MHTGPDAHYHKVHPLLITIFLCAVQDKLRESGVVDKLAPVTSAATETKVYTAEP